MIKHCVFKLRLFSTPYLPSSTPYLPSVLSLVSSQALSSSMSAVKPHPLSAPTTNPSHSCCTLNLTRWICSSAPTFSGHNRWSKIQHKKAIADEEKSRILTKFIGRIRSAIITSGGPNPDTNYKLASLIVQAKAAGITKSQIENIVKGEKKATTSEHIVCEARAQAGYLIVMEVLTSNKVRFRTQLKKILTKNGASIREAGSSLFNFMHKGVIRVPCQELLSSNTDADELAIEVGAEEVVQEDKPASSMEEESDSEKYYQFICDSREVAAVAKALKEKSFTVDSASLEYIPKTTVKLGQKDYDAAEKLMSLLDEHEEVVEVYDNFVLDEEN